MPLLKIEQIITGKYKLKLKLGDHKSQVALKLVLSNARQVIKQTDTSPKLILQAISNVCLMMNIHNQRQNEMAHKLYMYLGLEYSTLHVLVQIKVAEHSFSARFR